MEGEASGGGTGAAGGGVAGAGALDGAAATDCDEVEASCLLLEACFCTGGVCVGTAELMAEERGS